MTSMCLDVGAAIDSSRIFPRWVQALTGSGGLEEQTERVDSVKHCTQAPYHPRAPEQEVTDSGQRTAGAGPAWLQHGPSMAPAACCWPASCVAGLCFGCLSDRPCAWLWPSSLWKLLRSFTCDLDCDRDRCALVFNPSLALATIAGPRLVSAASCTTKQAGG